MPAYFFFIAAAAFVLSACGSSTPVQDIIEGRKVDYEQDEYQSGKELQYPPDVIADIDTGDGQKLLSEYRIEAVPNIGELEEVSLGEARKVAYRREGNVRWIDVDLSPDETWKLVLNFWENLNFVLAKEDPVIGTIETDWLDLRQRPTSLGLGSYLDSFLKRVRDSGERDKFITRVETRGEYSSIFVAHRHITAKFGDDDLFISYETLPPDPHIESEMLRRMMIFAAQSPQAEEATAFAEEISAVEAEAEGHYKLQATTLFIGKPLEESWLLVRIGLDRGGFTIDDQDYAESAYYISHTGGPESNQIFGKSNTSFFNKIFGEDKPVLREIKMLLHSAGEDQTTVVVQANDDQGELSEEQATVLLELLNANLP